MKLRKIYSEAIAHLPENIREEIIREAPHTRIQGPLPPELVFLGGGTEFVDLGFENFKDLGLSEEEIREIRIAFIGSGVAIPDTPYKLRYTKTGITVVEPATPDDIVLPERWKEAVLVIGDNNDPTYVGELVRPDQY